VGFGFATLDCKSDAIRSSSIGVLKLQEIIDWRSVDNAAVRMVILIAMRNKQVANGHMQVFSVLARKLMNEDFREGLLASKNSREMTQYLREELSLASHS